MVTPIVRIFKNVMSEGASRLITKNTPLRTTNLRWSSQLIKSDLVTIKKPVKLQDTRILVTKFINKHKNPESIEWKILERKLKKLNVENHRSEILQACLVLLNLEASISYFNYIKKNGEELTPLESIFIIKLFDKKKDRISEYENIVKDIYDKVKDSMKHSHVIQKFILKPISQVPSCFNDFVQNAPDEESVILKESHVRKAFELKNEKLAYKIMSNFRINENIFRYYINYLCQMAVENKFNPQMITTFIEYCGNNNNVICSSESVSLLRTLVQTLTVHEKNYEWTLNESKISDNNVCSCCKMKLIDKCISQKDFDDLKKTFLGKAGFIDRDVFLSTTDEELKRFSNFLKNAKYYDIVLDGLNILFKLKDKQMSLTKYMKYFLDKGKRLLIVSRVHAKSHFLNTKLLKNEDYKNRCQFFFTEDLSDDDVFIIYAALHGGLGTYLCSGDFLQRYIARLDNHEKDIFIKWKLYHQYVINNLIVYPPLPFLGLPQLTKEENGNRFIWHFSYHPEQLDPCALNSSVPLNWVCLQAHKKRLVES